MDPAILTPKQIADLVNYVLGLPIRRNGHHGWIRREAISACVFQSWEWRERRKVVNWAESQLRHDGILLRYNSGRHCDPPAKLQNIVGTSLKNLPLGVYRPE